MRYHAISVAKKIHGNEVHKCTAVMWWEDFFPLIVNAQSQWPIWRSYIPSTNLIMGVKGAMMFSKDGTVNFVNEWRVLLMVFKGPLMLSNNGAASSYYSGSLQNLYGVLGPVSWNSRKLILGAQYSRMAIKYLLIWKLNFTLYNFRKHIAKFAPIIMTNGWAQKITYRARKVIGSFEKWAPGSPSVAVRCWQDNGWQYVYKLCN